MSHKRYTLGELAEKLDAELVGDGEFAIEGIADLKSATERQASYLTEHPFGGSIRGYESAMKESQAGVIVMGRKPDRPEGKRLLLVDDPTTAFQQLVELFHRPIHSGFEGIHPTAVVHPSATLSEGVEIAPYAVIDRAVTIKERARIGAHCVVGAESVIGEDSILHPHVTVREGCQLGARVILQSGVVIGSCGFGYRTTKQGKHNKLAQLGQVILEDDVEVGANTTIDRSRFGKTVISQGTKIDNLVMIGHSVQIGEDNLIVAQTGIAGSTKTGKRVVLGGQVGVAGHIEICDDAIIAARSGVIGSLKEPGQYYGEPARPKAEARRYWMRLLALGRWYDKIKSLEAKVKELTTRQNSSQSDEDNH